MAVSEPIATFTRNHPTTGRKQERVAYTPDEVVNLRADGWVEKTTRGSSGGTGSSGSRSSSSTSNS
ncbi:MULTISPECIES: hypothetical protein [unclassified Micromonospora]|uniref:hypothetical protein n=1 Tax=unclassified Micromonospora TaxID=2617518 RepID=UPI0033183EFC